MDMFEPPKRADQNPFWPILLLTLSLIIWFSFQLAQIFKERDSQIAAYALQEAEVQKASKMRNTLDALAVGTYRLASKGNANARQLIDYLAKRGITILPPKQ
jgi:hypothetical protein